MLLNHLVMTKKYLTPSNAKKNFYQLLKDVNKNHTEIRIISERNDNNAVFISLEDWETIQETLLLEQTGTLHLVRKREKDHSNFTEITEIDWDNL